MKKFITAFIVLLMWLLPMLSCSLLPGVRTLYIQAVSDDAGGAIAGWQNDSGIYLQRIDQTGQVLWEKGGVKVSQVTNNFDAYAPPEVQFELTADGLGGAIVTWADTRNLKRENGEQIYFDPIPVYSQRVDKDGSILWGSDGVTTGVTAQIGEFPEMVTDGTGSAIFAWDDSQTYYKALHDDFLRLQKFSPQGKPQWGTVGVLVTASSPYRPVTAAETATGEKGAYMRTRPTYDGKQKLVSDGADGVFVLWEEQQASITQRNAYAQHIGSDGGILLAAPFLAGSGYEYSLTAAITGGTGEVMTVSATEIVYMRFPVNGEKTLPTRYSVALPWNTENAQSDGVGGVLFQWTQAVPPVGRPEDRQYELFLERLDKDGVILWPEAPFQVTSVGQQVRVVFAADGQGGAVVAWRMFGPDTMGGGQVFVQKILPGSNVSSLPLPSSSPRPVLAFNTAGIKYQGTPEVVKDGAGGAIVFAALGKGNGSGDMVYAQRIDGAPLWGDGIRIDK